MIEVTFQEKPIDIADIFNRAGTDADGAVVTFTGRARNNTRGRNVEHLEYELYSDMARKELEKICENAAGRWSLNTCIVAHRYGKVEIGEITIVIAVSSPHRDESYQASRFIIDTIKQRVPIWKKEFYEDGSQWISDTI